jgi:hypothetical protein
LNALLHSHIELAKKNVKEQKELLGEVLNIYKKDRQIPHNRFPPCMQNIINGAKPGRGPHRALAVLASYLYTAGWSDEDAFNLWNPIAIKSGVEPRIFRCWYGKMICPLCTSLQGKSSGYPQVGLGGLGYCEPNDKCKECCWPGGYASFKPTLLERALLALDKFDKFGKDDKLFGSKMSEKVRNGQHLTNEEYKHVYNMLDR